MNADDLLTLASARIARSAPDAWQQLLDAVSAYHAQNEQNLLKSPLDQLPTHQGRAQASARILGIMVDCKSRADKIEDRKK